MKTTRLTIEYDVEKLSALQQFADKKGVSVDAELVDTLDRLCDKHIPALVRDYIESRAAAPTAKPKTVSRNT